MGAAPDQRRDVGGQGGQRVFRRLARRDLRRLGDEPLEIGSERGAGRRLAGDACLETRFLFAGCKPFIPFGVKSFARLAEGRSGGQLGRASWRERMCQYALIAWVAVT